MIIDEEFLDAQAEFMVRWLCGFYKVEPKEALIRYYTRKIKELLKGIKATG